MDLGLKDKVVLITGATSGIGRALIDEMLKEGAKVAYSGRNKDKVDAIAKELSVGEDRAKGYVCDVTSEDACKAYVEAAKADFGTVDVACLNAGYEGKWQFNAEMTKDNFDDIFAVNVLGVMYMLKYVGPILQAQKSGSIVVTSSNGALVGSPGMALYCASKHAAQALVKSAARELGPDGIHVVSINPGGVETPMIRRIEINALGEQVSHEEASKGFTDGYLDKRYATAEEVAAAICYLASYRSAHCFGGRIVMDGGDECIRP